MKSTLLDEKIQIFSKLIDLTAALYHTETTNDNQRSYLLSILTKGLTLLSTDYVGLYSGKISSNAFNQLLNPSKNSEKFIRLPQNSLEISAKKIYTIYLSQIIGNPEALKNLYMNKLGAFHLITQKEYKLITQYLFKEDANALSKANILLIDKTYKELQPLIKTYNQSIYKKQ